MRAPGLDVLRQHIRPEVAASGGIALLVLTILGVCLWIVKPSLQEYRRLDRIRSDVISESESENAAAAEAAIETLGGEIAALREKLYGGSSAIPAREVESHVIGSLDDISRRHVVGLVRVAPGKPGRELIFEELPYDVHVTGGYFQLFDWLNEVEDALRPMVVKEFEISPEKASDRVGLKLRLVAYRVSEEKP